MKKATREPREPRVREPEMRTATFWSNNALKVSMGTNAPCGGDSGHGGRFCCIDGGFGLVSRSCCVAGVSVLLVKCVLLH